MDEKKKARLGIMKKNVNTPEKVIKYSDIRAYIYNFAGAYEVHIDSKQHPKLEKVTRMMQYLETEGFFEKTEQPIKIFVKKEMTEKELLEKIKEDTGCDQMEAEFILYQGVKSGIIKRQLDWRFYLKNAHYPVLFVLSLIALYYFYKYLTL